MSDPGAIPVTTGFTWTSLFTGGSFVTLVGLLIKQFGPWRKQTIDAEAQLREELASRVEKLEKQLEDERTAREGERIERAAELSLTRHRLNNVTQCLDTVFMLLEATPERVVEVVQKVREMREKQAEREAIESAQIHAAKIAAKAADKPAAD